VEEKVKAGFLIAFSLVMSVALASFSDAAMTIEQAVKTVEGLSGMERLARVEAPREFGIESVIALGG
jgi:hypothetical protein